MDLDAYDNASHYDDNLSYAAESTAMHSKLGLVTLPVAIAALGLAAYALTLGPYEADSDSEPAPRVSVDLEDLGARVRALEEKRRLESDAPDVLADLARRLGALERRVDTLPSEPEVAAAPPAVAIPGETTAKAVDANEPRSEDVERFQKLQDAAGRKKRERHHRRRIAAALESSGIVLGEKQTARLITAYGEFEARRNEIWSEAKQAGAAQGEAVDWPTVIADTQRVIVREFAESITPFIPAGDAEVISQALHARGK